MIIDTDKLGYEELDALITQLKARLGELSQPYWAEKARIADERRLQRAENEKKLEANAIEVFHTLVPGDIVKVTGTRNRHYPFREVTNVEAPKGSWSNGQFTGWQVRQLRDGTFQRGSEHTTHMANKIRGVVHRAELELVEKV